MRNLLKIVFVLTLLVFSFTTVVYASGTCNARDGKFVICNVDVYKYPDGTCKDCRNHLGANIVIKTKPNVKRLQCIGDVRDSHGWFTLNMLFFPNGHLKSCYVRGVIDTVDKKRCVGVVYVELDTDGNIKACKKTDYL